MEYVRNLKFDETPDYNSLRKLFKDFFNEKGFKDDGKYQWETHKKKTMENWRAQKDDKNFGKNFNNIGGKKMGIGTINLFANIKFKITEKIIEKEVECETTGKKNSNPFGLSSLKTNTP